MPFAWTAVYMMNVFNGKNSLERDSGSDKESIGSNSLGKNQNIVVNSGLTNKILRSFHGRPQVKQQL
jgi:hypothetical protein